MHKIIKAEYVIYDDSESLDEGKSVVIDNKAPTLDNSVGAVSEIVARANNYRDRIIKESEEEAKKIISEARKNALIISEKIEKEAYNKGYEDGNIQGRLDGKTQAMQEVVEENTKLRNQLKNIIEIIEASKQEILDDYERNLKDLAINIAENLIVQKLELDDSVIHNIVGNAIKDYRKLEWIKVYISESNKPEDVKIDKKLVEKLKEVSPDVKIEYVKDLEFGDCKIETPDCIVDVGVNTQVGNLRDLASNTMEN